MLEPCDLCSNIDPALLPPKEVTRDSTSKVEHEAHETDGSDFFNPFNIKFIILVGLFLFLALLYTDKGLITAVFASIILAPVYAAFFWLAGVILRIIVTSGYDEAKAYARKKGHNPIVQILYGIIGIVIFLLIFA